MPYTLQYRPVLIDTLISNARIASYQTVFSPANDMELMGAYLWNAHACGAVSVDGRRGNHPAQRD